MAAFASRVKTTWDVDPAGLVAHARIVAAETERRLASERDPDGQATVPLRELPDESRRLILTDSISPRPLHAVLTLLDVLEELRDDRFSDHERLALAKSVVFSSSNLHFGPEVGVGRPRDDAPVVQPWLAAVQGMADDLAGLRFAYPETTPVATSTRTPTPMPGTPTLTATRTSFPSRTPSQTRTPPPTRTRTRTFRSTQTPTVRARVAGSRPTSRQAASAFSCEARRSSME